MDNQEIKELSRRQKFASRIGVICFIILGGAFLLLVGLVDAMPHIRVVIAATILLVFASIFLLCAIVQKNSISFWIAVMFLVPFVVEILVINTAATYGLLYPLYITSVFIACLFTGIIWRNISPHLFMMVLFGGLGLLFFLQSTGVASYIDGRNGWAFVAPLAAAHFVACVIFVIIKLSKKGSKTKSSNE